MKTIYILLVSVLLLIFGCTENKNPTHYLVSVVVDETELFDFKNAANYALHELKKTSIHDGFTLKLTSISDTRFNLSNSFSIRPVESSWFANDDLRRETRKYIFKQFQDSIQTMNAFTRSHQKSEVFRLVSAELNGLASKTGPRKLVLITDLKENSDIFSSYNQTQVQWLFAHPDKVAEHFKSSVKLTKDLTGIVVEIVYQPSFKDDALFASLVDLYVSILEPRGAKVSVRNQNSFIY